MHTSDLPSIRTLLGVWAHPDDEAYLSAGLMLRVSRQGGRVVCLTATNGERGTDNPGEWPPERLGPHRIAELTRALQHVNAEPPRLLGLPDGGCHAIEPDGPVAAIGRAIEELRPDLIVTFGPDGMTGHPDHVAVSGWATRAAYERDTPIVYATVTPQFMRHNAARHRRLGIFPPGYPHPAIDGDQLVAGSLDDEELERKRAVLDAHASQTAGLARMMGSAAFTRWWATEWFRAPRASERTAQIAS